MEAKLTKTSVTVKTVGERVIAANIEKLNELS
jgi:hypothetical protein